MMPCYVNIGAYVDSGTMVDTWATVASCAQIGKNVHLSGGVGIGGVLEPPQAKPVVVEDDCVHRLALHDRRTARACARARSSAPGSSSPTPRRSSTSTTGDEVGRGVIPERAIVVQGTRMKEFAGGTFGLPCALILRYLAEGEEHDRLQAQRDPARARRRLVTRSARAHRAAVRDPVGQRQRSARSPTTSRRGCARARRSSTVERIGENVVARTDLGRERRIVLGGHLDTVPPNDNAATAPRRRHAARPRHRRHEGRPGGPARPRGQVSAEPPRHDVTLVFYEGEEVADEHNGLRQLFARTAASSSPAISRSCSNRRRLGRSRLSGHDPRARDVRRCARRTRPGRGWE